MPFVKLDCGILDSSIWLEPSDTRIVWITMLAMADSTGFIPATAPGISRRACVPIQQTRQALQRFESPDPESRSISDEGRRATRVDGGYIILNYNKYRDKDHTAAVRVREHRERERSGFNGIATKQGWKCDCCDRPFEKPYSKYVVQDHDHQTEEYRALVCQSCNKVIGQIENGTTCVSSKLEVARDYLKRWSNACNRNATQAEAEAEAEVERTNPLSEPEPGSDLILTPPSKNGNADPRFKPAVDAIKSYWDLKNPGRPFVFGPSDGKQLKQFLKDCGQLTIEQFEFCLDQRAHSQVVHSDRPCKWISDLMTFANGPLDKFKRSLNG